MTEAQKARQHEELEAPAVYLRFGGIPKSGRSRNTATGIREIGVSVFSASRLGPGKYRVILPNDVLGMELAAQALYNRRVYEVTGEELGLGHEGEPLIRVADYQRLEPPISLIPDGREEAIDYYIKTWRERLMREKGGIPYQDTSRLQQVTRLGVHTFGNKATKKKRKNQKR